MTLKVGLISLGCPKNQVDSEVMQDLLEKAGFEFTAKYESATILIVNTCGFIAAAKEESVNTILELTKLKSKGNCQLVVVVGCMVQKFQKELSTEIPEVDVWLGVDQVEAIVAAVTEGLAGKRIISVNKNPTYLYMQAIRSKSTVSHSAYLKIAEGCNNLCSYCVIPQLRGSYQSRTMEAVVAEAEALVDNGAVELILVAQDTTMYGIDLYGDFMLVELLQKLLVIKKLRWVRLLYCYPAHINTRLIELIRKEEQICNYLDIPLQHADNEILKKMNRKSSQEKVIHLLTKLKKNIPDLAIRTTFIIGFPGETEEYFNNLLAFLKKFRFNWVGVFPYSREEDTPAYSFKKQIPEEIKNKRVQRLMETQQQITALHNSKYINKNLLVLVEGISEANQELFYGRTQYQAPDIDGITFFTAASTIREPEKGDFVLVKITHVDNYDIIGEMVL